MKKLLTLALVFGSLNAYEIKFDKSFEKNIEPNILSTQVSVESEMEKETQVKADLDKFSKFFSELKNVKLKRASMSINPKYTYEKDKATCVGYYGTLNYEIKSKNAKDMNDFITNFFAFKEKTNSKIKTNLSRIHWEIGKKPYQKAVSELRIEALLWAKKYANELEKTFDDKCSLKEVVFNEAPKYFERNNIQTLNSSVKFVSKSSTTYLLKNKEAISINPNFTFKCK